MRVSKTWDVAIVGAGTAGLPAAIIAARRGLQVLLIDAAERIGGTMYLSSGSLAAGGAERQLAKGIEDSAGRHRADCERLGHGSANPDVLKLWTENAPAMVDWLIAEGVTFGPEMPTFSAAHEAYDAPRTYTPSNGALEYIRVFSAALDEQVAAGKIDLRLSTRMTSLATADDGGVIGVKVEGPDGAETLAAHDVVLTTGGYAYDDALWQSLHTAPRRVFAYPFARGDGLRAAAELGAKIDYADNFLPTFGASQDLDDDQKFWIHSRVSPAFRPPYEISVNLNGDRFMAEDLASPDGRERTLIVQPDQSFWVVYDERIRREAPPLFMWDEEKVARAFAESPNFQSAASIAELAEACALDPARLERTVAGYNSAQAVQSDLFKRTHMPLPISEGPFYAIRHFATSVVSWGGIVVDGDLRVLGAAGQPIPHLYAAGEVLGMGVFGHTFLGGSTVSSSITFGKLLGERLGGGEMAPGGAAVYQMAED
jgi:fumarate reductase flavoprotein subunit